ncbi:MAG: bifunctional DNA-binding transcriptional regulator/O6-methylguanine-DNA methyltransferase Ada [Sneathiellaceae bacterium]
MLTESAKPNAGPAGADPLPEQRHAAEFWDAVCARDARYDGIFVYAVATTGVYCPPSCRGRQPRRQNTAFYASPGAAEAAGFRPCRRCARDARAADAEVAGRIADACQRMAEADPEDGMPDLNALAQEAGLSPGHFQRQFKAFLGLTPAQFAEGLRMLRARDALRQGEDVLSALFAAGYGAPSRFYAAAPKYLGMKPAQYRKGARGQRIAWSAAATRLGCLGIAATAKGLCWVHLDSDPLALELALQREFPEAELANADGDLAAWRQQLADYVDGRAPWPLLPVDLRGTAFQLAVWEALRQIPAGTTLSYAELASRIGKPRAVRAVATACAANRVALAVPCHRIVRGDGSLSGYRWGPERKAALLAGEQEGAPA